MLEQAWQAQLDASVLEHLDEAGHELPPMNTAAPGRAMGGHGGGLAAHYASIAASRLAGSQRLFGEVRRRAVDLVLEHPVAWGTRLTGNARR